MLISEKAIFFLFIVANLVYGQYIPENIIVENESHDQHETAIAINPNNSNHIFATWNDFRNTIQQPGYGFSNDGGLTWSTGTIVPSNNYNYGFDPSCYFNKYGTAFYAYIAYNPVNILGPVYLSKTNNNGSTWTSHKVSVANTKQDKCYMTIDNTQSNYSNRIYITWVDFSNTSKSIIKLGISSDLGLTWDEKIIDEKNANPGDAYVYTSPESPMTGSTDGFVQAPIPRIGPNGELYIVWLDYGAGNTSVLDCSLKFRKSVDGGFSFGAIENISSFKGVWKWDGYGIIRPSSFPSFEIDHSNGNLYLTYVAYNLVNNKLDIKFTRSLNGGNNWSSPIIPTMFSNSYQFFPGLSVNNDGKISIVFHKQTTSNILDTYITESFNYGASFYPTNAKLSSTSFDPDGGNPSKGSDYIGIASIGKSRVIPIWATTQAPILI